MLSRGANWGGATEEIHDRARLRSGRPAARTSRYSSNTGISLHMAHYSETELSACSNVITTLNHPNACLQESQCCNCHSHASCSFSSCILGSDSINSESGMSSYRARTLSYTVNWASLTCCPYQNTIIMQPPTSRVLVMAKS